MYLDQKTSSILYHFDSHINQTQNLLQTSGLNIKAANSLTEAATIATSLIKK